MTEIERRQKALLEVEKLASEHSQIGAVALVLMQAIGVLRDHTDRIKTIESKLGINRDEA
jgi:hypothetical protein